MPENFIDSECVSCGACVQACPTDALREKTVLAEGPADPFGGHDLRLLRRRLLVQGRDARRRSHAHGAVQGRQGQSRPFLREGPLRLGLRHPQGPHPQPDDPRKDQRSLARSELGRGVRPRRQASSAASSTSMAAARSAASPRRAAPTRRPISSRSWCGRASATTMSTPAPASAIRRPATGCGQTFGTSAGTQDFDSRRSHRCRR